MTTTPGPLSIRDVLSAALVTAIDVALLLFGLRSGWFSGGGLLVSAWAQSALLIVAVPAMLLVAAGLAPDTPEANALLQQHDNGQGVGRGGAATPGLSMANGRTFTSLFAVFFLFHYGIFLAGIGMTLATVVFTGVGLGESIGAGIVLLALRSVLANLPSVLADARFLRAEGSSFLLARTMTVVGMAYRRMVPLHVGIIALGFLDIEWWSYGIVAIIGTTTFIGAMWRYPTQDRLAARSQTPTPAPAPSVPGAPPPPPQPTGGPPPPPPPGW